VGDIKRQRSPRRTAGQATLSIISIGVLYGKKTIGMKRRRESEVGR
jgi:hypothetical protein